MTVAIECLRHTRKLDPRPSDIATSRPIRGAVNIPLAELGTRLMELPPRGRCIEIAAEPALADATSAYLDANGWRTRHVLPRYEGRQCSGLRLWEPNAFLAKVVRGLRPGRALDLGAGSGRNAVFLSAMGWQLTAVDVLQDAIQLGRRLEERYLPSCPRITPIQWICLDLERQFDAIGGSFDLIVGFYFLYRPIFHQMVKLITPGGSVIWETFTEEHRRRYGKPRTERYALRNGELPTYFPSFDVQHHSEAWRKSGERRLHTARIWAVYSP